MTAYRLGGGCSWAQSYTLILPVACKPFGLYYGRIRRVNLESVVLYEEVRCVNSVLTGIEFPADFNGTVEVHLKS